MKKTILMSSLLALTLAFTACQGSEKTEKTSDEKSSVESSQVESTSSGKEEFVVEIVAKGFQHQFWKTVNDGANKAASDLGAKITFQGPKSETDIQEQVQMLNNAINKKPNAIALAALDTKAEIDSLNSAKSNGIPIIGFDSGVPDAPEGTVLATAATDNVKAAELAAEKHFDALKDKLEKATAEKPVRLGVVSQEVNSSSITDRTKGYIDKMKELLSSLDNVKDKVAVTGHDKFKEGVSEGEAVVIIELRVPAQVTDADGQTQAQTLLNKEDLIGIYGSNEFGAKAIINADNAVGGKIGKDVVAVGFDSGELQINAVKSKQFLGSVTQDPFQIGYKAVELSVKAAKGEKVEDVDTGAKWYDASNIDSDEIAPLLYK
ncbi:MAG: ABC transporter substrate-binding protein [Anaerococcus sp.]|nr:ABC transporter substrate-binding protein [Anaerococcus sp.]